MKGKIGRFLVIGAIGTLAVVGIGGALVGGQVFAADPPSTTETTLGCGGAGYGTGGMMGGLGGIMGGIGGMMGGAGGMMGGILNTVTTEKLATLLGLTPQDLTTQLGQGKSLVELATNKATEQQLIDTILAPHLETMKLQVEQGYMTQTQVDQMTQWMTQAAKTTINSKTLGTKSTDPRGMFGGTGGTGSGARTGGMMGGYGWY